MRDQQEGASGLKMRLCANRVLLVAVFGLVRAGWLWQRRPANASGRWACSCSMQPCSASGRQQEVVPVASVSCFRGGCH